MIPIINDKAFCSRHACTHLLKEECPWCLAEKLTRAFSDLTYEQRKCVQDFAKHMTDVLIPQLVENRRF